MKRQKRDLTSRAYVRGYRAGVSGKSQDKCPTQTGVSREHWISGWRQGREDFWDGYQGISNLHCSPAIP
jgi:ribosome modulation factor